MLEIKDFEYMSERPKVFKYKDKKGKIDHKLSGFISSNTLCTAIEKEYLNKMSALGWRLIGTPLTTDNGDSYIYYWEREIK